jgi:hypothetical protein
MRFLQKCCSNLVVMLHTVLCCLCNISDVCLLNLLLFHLVCRRERFKHRSADVARCWAKYGLLLLSNSKERLMSEANENESETSDRSNTDTQELGNTVM